MSPREEASPFNPDVATFSGPTTETVAELPLATVHPYNKPGQTPSNPIEQPSPVERYLRTEQSREELQKSYDNYDQLFARLQDPNDDLRNQTTRQNVRDAIATQAAIHDRLGEYVDERSGSTEHVLVDESSRAAGKKQFMESRYEQIRNHMPQEPSSSTDTSDVPEKYHTNKTLMSDEIENVRTIAKGAKNIAAKAVKKARDTHNQLFVATDEIRDTLPEDQSGGVNHWTTSRLDDEGRARQALVREAQEYRRDNANLDYDQFDSPEQYNNEQARIAELTDDDSQPLREQAWALRRAKPAQANSQEFRNMPDQALIDQYASAQESLDAAQERLAAATTPEEVYAAKKDLNYNQRKVARTRSVMESRNFFAPEQERKRDIVLRVAKRAARAALSKTVDYANNSKFYEDTDSTAVGTAAETAPDQSDIVQAAKLSQERATLSSRLGDTPLTANARVALQAQLEQVIAAQRELLGDDPELEPSDRTQLVLSR